MAAPRVTGHVKTVQRKRGPVFYLKYRLVDGRQVETLLGRKWTGKRGRIPGGYFTDKTAQEELDAVLADARRGTLAVGAEKGSGVTFEDVCAEWLRYGEHDKQIAQSTLSDYRNVVNRYLLPAFGKATPVEQITTRSIDAYREQLLADGHLSRRSVQKVLVLLYGVEARQATRLDRDEPGGERAEDRTKALRGLQRPQARRGRRCRTRGHGSADGGADHRRGVHGAAARRAAGAPLGRC